jgi:uncharacterized protein (DUF433 family)
VIAAVGGDRSTIVEMERDAFLDGSDEMTTNAASEAEKMARVPGIVFADGPAGRRARLAGTGLEVFEVVLVDRAGGGDWAALREHFDWLSEAQLQAARRYFELYPEDVLPFVEAIEAARIEDVWRQYPQTRPRPR